MVILQSEWTYFIRTLRGKPVLQIPTDYTVFGITQEIVHDIYDQLFDFVYYSEGAFSYTEVRSWPLQVRSYYISKLAKILHAKAEQIKNANSRAGRPMR